MKNSHKPTLMLAILLAGLSVIPRPSANAQIVTGEELQRVTPKSYFYAGQSPSVQERNSAALKNTAGKFTLAGLVDTSGYSTAIAEKYQGYLITESKLTFDGATLEIGAYGFGFKDGKFIVTNVAAGDVFSVASQRDDQLKHPVPLKFEKTDAGYRLYAGRNYVTFKTE